MIALNEMFFDCIAIRNPHWSEKGPGARPLLQPMMTPTEMFLDCIAIRNHHWFREKTWCQAASPSNDALVQLAWGMS